jgi:integrase
MTTVSTSFRVGKVQGYLRGQIWSLCYHEAGRRRRPRVGPDRTAARQMAAQINGQLAVGAPAALSFDGISIPLLRENWLEHHEQVLRSSVSTLARYRTATEHLLRFLSQHPVKHVAQFHTRHAQNFVRYLRSIQIAPNGHANTAKRPLMDKGLRYILECCRSLFNYAAKRRHLPPYAENPFCILEIDRIPVQQVKPVILFTPEQERAFLQACDDWQFPLFLTLMLTGLRSGELCHLLLPDDLDMAEGLLYVRNKPALGWQVKTRNERVIPLHPDLVAVLRGIVNGRCWGPVFRRRQFRDSLQPFQNLLEWERALKTRSTSTDAIDIVTRADRAALAEKLWRQQGRIREDRVRLEFMGLTRRLGLNTWTAPKMFRHLFATALQEGNVDPLIRNELMGHVAAGDRTAGHGLAMTAVYTHTRPATRRKQLELALEGRPALAVARAWIATHRECPELNPS